MTAPRISRLRSARVVPSLALSLAVGLAMNLAVVARTSQAAGLALHADADGKDLGLPIYPGAVKRAEPDSNSGAFSFGLWGDSFGFKMAVGSYRSADGVDAIASFYRDALAKFGPVLDCSGARKSKGTKREEPQRGVEISDKDRPVSCDNDSAEPGGRLYKVGVERSQRVVQIKPSAAGTEFTLVHVHVQGSK